MKQVTISFGHNLMQLNAILGTSNLGFFGDCSLSSEAKKKLKRGLGKDYLQRIKNVQHAVETRLSSNKKFFGYDFVTGAGTANLKINLKVYPNALPTFRFFGMSLTESLDVVVSGFDQTVVAFNLYDAFLAYVTEKYPGLRRLLNFTFDSFKLMVEDFKINFDFNSFSQSGYFKKYLNASSGGAYSSVTLAFLLEKLSLKSGFGSADEEDTIISDFFIEVLDYYGDFSIIVAVLSEYLAVASAILGEDNVYKNVLPLLTDSGSVGDLKLLRGMCPEEYIFGKAESLEAAKTLFTDKKNSDITFAEHYYTLGMVDYSCYDDVTLLSRDQILAGSLIDLIKLKDPDLSVLGHNPVTEPDLVSSNLSRHVRNIIRHVDGVIKRDFWGDGRSSLEDVAVAMAFSDPGDEEVVAIDIFNKNKTVSPEAVQFQALIKASDLMRKVFKEVLAQFS